MDKEKELAQLEELRRDYLQLIRIISVEQDPYIERKLFFRIEELMARISVLEEVLDIGHLPN